MFFVTFWGVIIVGLVFVWINGKIIIALVLVCNSYLRNNSKVDSQMRLTYLHHLHYFYHMHYLHLSHYLYYLHHLNNLHQLNYSHYLYYLHTCITSITRITCITCKTCITFTTCITYIMYIMYITCVTCITWIILFAEYLKKYVLVTLLKRWISVSHAKLCIREMLAHLKISVGVSSVGNNADAQIVQAVWLDRMSVDAPLLFVPIYSCWRTPTDVPFPNLSLKTWK